MNLIKRHTSAISEKSKRRSVTFRLCAGFHSLRARTVIPSHRRLCDEKLEYRVRPRADRKHSYGIKQNHLRPNKRDRECCRWEGYAHKSGIGHAEIEVRRKASGYCANLKGSPGARTPRIPTARTPSLHTIFLRLQSRIQVDSFPDG